MYNCGFYACNHIYFILRRKGFSRKEDMKTMKIWKEEKLREMYDKVKEEAIKAENGSDENNYSVDEITQKNFPTRSPRIKVMIFRAYTLGKMKGISMADDKYAEIRQQEANFNETEVEIIS